MNMNIDSMVNDTLNTYCAYEVKLLQCSPLFLQIKNLAANCGFSVDCSYGANQFEKRSSGLFLSIEILDSKNHVVNLTNEGGLSIYTMLVWIKNDGWVKFFQWQNDKEFIDDMQWIQNRLLELCKKP